MRSLLAFSLLALVPALAGAQDMKPLKVVDLKRTDAVAYEKEIEPILYKKCFSCHSESQKKGKLDMATYEALVKGGRSGSPIKPGKGKDSLIYQSVMRTAEPFMPPEKHEPMTPAEAALVKLWIDQGAKAPTGKSLIVKQVVVVGTPPASVVPVRALAVSADKKYVVASRGNKIHLYDGSKGDYLRSFSAPDVLDLKKKAVDAAHLSLVESLAISPDGKYVVSGSYQEVSIWNPEDGKRVHKIDGFKHMVVALAFSADGKYFATGGGEPTGEGEVKVFDVPSWKQYAEILNGHSDTVYGLSFSPDNKMIATCSADKFIKTWELPSGKFVKSFEGHTHHVLDVGWQADGKMLASAGGDNTVKIWDFEKGEQVRTIQAHTKQVTRLMFVGKKAEILTSGGDNQVKLFNVANGSVSKTYAGATDFVYAIGASADGSVVASGGQEGVVRLYNGTSGALVKALYPPDAQPAVEEKKKEEKKKK